MIKDWLKKYRVIITSEDNKNSHEEIVESVGNQRQVIAQALEQMEDKDIWFPGELGITVSKFKDKEQQEKL